MAGGARAPTRAHVGLEAQVVVEVLISWAQLTPVASGGLGIDTHALHPRL